MIPWLLQKIFGTKHERELKKMRPVVAAINDLEPKMRELSEDELRRKTIDFKERIGNGESLDKVLPEAFAVCREAGRRVLNMRHFDVQLIGGMVLNKGWISEMKTGEGKTLVATLPSYLNALEGKGVHIVTVNDYLATRDAEWMGKIHQYLGLTVGTVVHSQSDREKKAAYRADITYGQNNEFGFDYLRDNMKYSLYDCAQRELNFAIVDEVDSILIDEARTPLIISGQGEASTHLYGEITKIIPYLRKDEHYLVDEKAHSVALTDEGIDEAQERLKIGNIYDTSHIEELHVLQQCLRAHTLYKRDVNYMVSDDGKVMIIDEFTGRVLAGRRWSDGLHQAVEAKEFVRVQEENRTMATITFQNLFRLYKKLSGMTGTAETEAEELHKIYKLEVNQIPTNKVIKRQDFDDLVYRTEREKFKAVVEEIADCVERGQPSLVGTVSVEKSEAIASLLRKRNIKHEVLNAKQHEREAYIIAQAGRKSSVTVATNMAGRGTDIILGGNPEMLAKAEMLLGRKDPTAPENQEELAALVESYKTRCEAERTEVTEAGGLHIIGTERHESRRIDNQLRGRAGRQGDPGSSRFYLSLEDDLMRIFAGDKTKELMDRLGMEEDVPIEHPWVTSSVANAQRKVEARNFDIRKNVLEYDDVMNQQRKAVYKIRREVLEGSYVRDAKAKGEEEEDHKEVIARDLDAKTIERVETVCNGILRHFPVAKTMPKTDSSSQNEGYRGPTVGVLPPAATLDEMEAFDAERAETEVYHYFGAKVSLDKHADNPKEALEYLKKAVCKSLQSQRERLLDLMDNVIATDIEKHCPPNVSRDEWNLDAVASLYREKFGIEPKDLEQYATLDDLAAGLFTQAEKIHLDREASIDMELVIRAFRSLFLEEIDRAWIDHLTNMDHLRDGIGLRGYGQRDPKLEFKKEGFEMFTAMMASVHGGIIEKLFHLEFRQAADIERLEAQEAQRAADRARRMVVNHVDESAIEGALDFGNTIDTSKLDAVRKGGPTSRKGPRSGPSTSTATARPSAPPASAGGGSASIAPTPTDMASTAGGGMSSLMSSTLGTPSSAPVEAVTRRAAPKTGRNDLCPCGSGKKYKKCHGATAGEAESAAESTAPPAPTTETAEASEAPKTETGA